jgi:phage terminase large subunit-like protein
VAEAFSAEQPESLRGPQFTHAWCDELAKWRQAEAAFDNLQFALRLGTRPRQLVTTTPRPIGLLKRLIADPATVLSHAATQANARNLSAAFIDHVVARYGGTRLGRQEIDGEIIDERSDALWSRAMLEGCRITKAPEALMRVVVAVDPPVSSTRRADACGLIAAGMAEGGTIYVLADDTCAGLSPQAWASKAVALYHRLAADSLVVEVNQGGDLVRAVIREVDRSVPVTEVRATRGKWLRAEPVAQLFEQGRVRLAGAFPELEDEMCDFGVDGLSSGRSPDRVDALVWAVTALNAGAKWQPRVRVV